MCLQRAWIGSFFILINFIVTSLVAANFENIKSFKNEAFLTDKILVSKEQQEFPCHQLILASYSSYFKTMFSRGFKESNEKRIYLDYSAATIKIILDLIYSGNETVKDALELNSYFELMNFANQSLKPELEQALKKIPLYMRENASQQEIADVLALDDQILTDREELKSEDQTLLDRIFADSHIKPVIIFRRESPYILHSVDFSSDRKKIVGGNSSCAKVIDITNGLDLLTLQGHTNFVYDTVFSYDGKKIATASNDKTVKIWDLTSLTDDPITLPAGGGNRHHGLAFSSDSTKLLRHDNWSIKVYDLTNGSDLEVISEYDSRGTTSCTFSPDNKRIAVSYEHGLSKIFDATNGQELLVLRGYHWGSILSSKFSQDGAKIVITSDRGIAKIFNAFSGEPLLILSIREARVYAASFNSDGTKIVIGADDATARVFDAINGKELWPLPHSWIVHAVAFCGEKVITASSNHYQMWALPPRELCDNQSLQHSSQRKEWLLLKLQLENYLKNLHENEPPSYKIFMRKASQNAEDFACVLNKLLVEHETLKEYLHAVFYDFYPTAM